MNEFTLNEAVALIYRHAVLKSQVPEGQQPSTITQIGHVCGVLTLNDQIELVIKFHEELRQFTKQEFDDEVRLMSV